MIINNILGKDFLHRRIVSIGWEPTQAAPNNLTSSTTSTDMILPILKSLNRVTHSVCAPYELRWGRLSPPDTKRHARTGVKTSDHLEEAALWRAQKDQRLGEGIFFDGMLDTLLINGTHAFSIFNGGPTRQMWSYEKNMSHDAKLAKVLVNEHRGVRYLAIRGELDALWLYNVATFVDLRRLFLQEPAQDTLRDVLRKKREVESDLRDYFLEVETHTGRRVGNFQVVWLKAGQWEEGLKRGTFE